MTEDEIIEAVEHYRRTRQAVRMGGAMIDLAQYLGAAGPKLDEAVAARGAAEAQLAAEQAQFRQTFAPLLGDAG